MALGQSSTTTNSRIYQLLFGLGFLGIAVNTVKGMMRGQMRNARMLGALSIAVGIVLALDTYFWILCPISWMYNIQIPGLPFNSKEIGCLAVTAVHFIRLGLGKEEPVRWNQRIVVTMPLFFWIALIWAMRPTGLNMFGSSTMGGRFYIDIVIGYLAMLALSTVRIGEKEARYVFGGMVVAAGLNVWTSVAMPNLLSMDTSDSGEQIGTRYRLLCFVAVYWLLFARYSLRDIFSKGWRLTLAALSAGFILLSGKRSSSAAIGLIPIYRAALTKKQWGLTAIAGVVVFSLLLLVSAGDGTYYHIPRSALRPLAMVIPKYRSRRGLEGVKDTFRDAMRQEAKRIIRNHPWIGRGGFRMSSSETRWINWSGLGGAYGGHIVAGAWHSALYAYPADFGIPALLFWLLFLGYALRFLFRFSNRIRDGTYHSACTYYFGFLLIHSAVLIYTSGGTSSSTMQLCYQYGMLMALANGLDRDNGILS